MAIEAMHEKTEEAMCKLLQTLFRSFVITIDQMKNVSWVVLTENWTFCLFLPLFFSRDSREFMNKCRKCS